MIYKFFCFFATLFFVMCANAQDDIGFLFDDDDSFSATTPAPKPTPAPVQKKEPASDSKPKPASKPIKFNQTNNKPNLGTNAQPLTTLDVLPPPAPRVTIDLTSTPAPSSVQPIKPVNMRTQAIDILPNSLWDDTVSGGTTPLGIGGLHNVRAFELEGFYLGMTPEDVLTLAHENNYKVISSKDTISKFRTGYYESWCKSQGIRLPADIRACIAKMSKANGTTYLSVLKIARPSTKESIEFNFSSPATDNRVWKIHYESKGDNSLNFTAANTRRKLDRQDAFFNAVFDKFGNPDDPKNYIWGSEDDAFMRVGMYGSNYDAYITLTDVELSDDDYFEAKDWLDESKPFEHFGFED